MVRRVLLSASFIAAWLGIAVAQHSALSTGGGNTPQATISEFTIVSNTWNNNSGFNDLTILGTRTLRSSPLINTGINNLGLIIAGQSNIESEAPTAYVPTNSSAVDNLNIYDGGIYGWVDPPLGSGWVKTSVGGGSGSTCASTVTCGHVGGRIADNLINSGKFARVIVAPIAIASTPISAWDIGGALYGRPCVAMQRFKDHQIVAGTGVTLAFIWGQGETDNLNSTSAASYKASWANIVSKLQSCGFSGRFFIAEQTFNNNVASATIQGAQTSLVDNVTTFAGPNADALTGNTCGSGGTSACRISDNTHFTDAGAFSYAAAWQTAMHASGSPY